MVATNENSLEGEQIDFKKIKISNNQAIVIVLIVGLIIGFAVGNNVGTRESYTYVKSYYEEKINRFCVCKNQSLTINEKLDYNDFKLDIK